MRNESLRDREIAILFESTFTGQKWTIDQATDLLEVNGFISDPSPDEIRAYKKGLARDILKRIGKYNSRVKDAKLNIENLREFDEAGNPRNYYIFTQDMDIPQFIQVIESWDKRNKQAEQNIIRLVKVGTEIHGKRFRRAIPKNLPFIDLIQA
jgi:hypothetical protein